MFPNKNWSLGVLNSADKKLTTQVLCGQSLINHYPYVKQQYLHCHYFFDQHFQSTKTPVFVSKYFKKSLCSIFLIFLQRFDQVLIFSAKSHHWRIGINWRHIYVINSKECVTNRWTVLNIYNQYSFSYKCWNLCANRLIWLDVIKENTRRCSFSEHSVVLVMKMNEHQPLCTV